MNYGLPQMKTAFIIGLTDEQHVRNIQNGDINGISYLYSKYFNRVYQKCYSYTKNKDDAFDLAQDILLKAFEKLSGYKGKSSYSTWLYAITHNHCITHVIKHNKYNNEIISEGFEIADDSLYEEEELMQDSERKEADIQRILNEIPSVERDMLEKKYRYNYSIQDLQKEFNLSASAVKMRLMRARQRMEQKLTVLVA